MYLFEEVARGYAKAAKLRKEALDFGRCIHEAAARIDTSLGKSEVHPRYR